MSKGFDSLLGGSTPNALKTKLSQLLHRKQTSNSAAPNDQNNSSKDRITPELDNSLSSLTVGQYLTKLTPVDPFIEHDEIRRQKQLTEKYDDRFLKRPGMQLITDCCDSCSKIDFDAISDPKAVLEGDVAFSLREIGRINASWLLRTCRFCRFLGGLWEDNKNYLRNAHLCLIVLSSRHLSNHSGTDRASKSNYHHNVLVLSHPQPRRVFSVDDTVLDNIDIVGALFPKRRKVDTKKSVSVRSIQGDVIDFAAVREWLRLCSKHHGKICLHSEPPNIPGFQLLNCETKQLELYESGTKFAALSYVWGSNVEEQMKESSDEGFSDLPLTIKDALKVTLELGLQYLWVDRYCVPQSNSNAKHIQIASMDLIYSCASLTIIAACETDSAFGLPGVSSRSRLSQPIVTIGDYEIISTGSNPERDVRDSAWMSRGWTYQEGLLSTRRLHFTDKQVFFGCGGGIFKEAVSEPEKVISERAIGTKREIPLRELTTYSGTRHCLFPADHINQRHEGACLIHDRIAEYTSRSLTFESDTINAFLGVLRHFKNPDCSFSHAWGVPVLWSSEKWTAMEGFATGLCWIGIFPTTQTISRRANFPSWSWAGWNWEVSTKSYFYRFGFKTPYDIQVSFETKSGDILDWKTHHTLCQNNQVPSLSPYLHIDAWSLTCRLFHAGGGYSLREYSCIAVEGSEITLPSVVIHKLYSSEDWEARKDNLWDVIIIGNTEAPVGADKKYFELLPPFGPFFMILEDMGGWHERIGYMDLAHCDLTAVGQDMSQHLVRKERRSFRLG